VFARADADLIGGCYFNTAIGFPSNESGDDGSYNEMLRVEATMHTIKGNGNTAAISSRNALTNEGGAEYLWRMFIEPLQR